MSKPKFDIAIHAPHAAAIYTRNGRDGVGGAELQTFYLARMLAAAGLDVCHIVVDRPDLPDSYEGVRLVRQAMPHHHNIAQYTQSVTDALRRADAKIYVQRTGSYETGIVALWARARRRRFVFASSSLLDVMDGTAHTRTVNRLGASLGMRLADVLVMQTDEQLARLHGRRASRARVIRSFCEVPDSRSAESREAFLWIGGLIDYKDPLAYVELARRLPEARFWMVGTPRDGHADIAAQVAAAAERLPNLELLPSRPRADLLPLYERAVAVVNTSLFEGFPNTFMEGWARGTPALSLRIDPDGIVSRHGLGTVAGADGDRLAAAAVDLWERRDDLETLSQRTYRYVRDEHAPNGVAARWVSLLEEIGSPTPSRLSEPEVMSR
jgi:glycosyltransferase involved in cell wall biosynthesis